MMSAHEVDVARLVAEGRRMLNVEAAALSALSDRLGREFADACHLIASADGRVITCGIGKSGHIARKVAATLTSTGSPAMFLHPVEALHGDLGLVAHDDVALIVSKSGRAAEMDGLLSYFSRLGVPIVALVGAAESPLAKEATVVLDCSVEEEACPMDLAPSSSSTAALAMGDALALTVLQLHGFKSDDFAAFHPKGSLGRKLSVRVSDVMISDGYPSLDDSCLMRDAIGPLAEMRGTVPIIDGTGSVCGVVTAGDLTRLMEQRTDFLTCPVRDIMTQQPKTARPNELGSAAVSRMEAHRIMALPVVGDDGTLRGMIHLHDLMKAGAV